jgi:hypothetical protein
VRAQVDRDLTTVNWVDRLLELIKNLGRHIHLLANDQLRELVHESMQGNIYKDGFRKKETETNNAFVV